MPLRDSPQARLRPSPPARYCAQGFRKIAFLFWASITRRTISTFSPDARRTPGVHSADDAGTVDA